MPYRVKEGWQVKHDGKMYHGGDTIQGAQPRQADVQKWLGAGLVDEVKESKASDDKPAAKKTTTKGAN